VRAQLGTFRVHRGAGLARFGRVRCAVGAQEWAAVTDFGLAIRDAVGAFGARVRILAVVVDVGVVDELFATDLTQRRAVGACGNAIRSSLRGSWNTVANTTLAVGEWREAIRIGTAFPSNACGWSTLLVHQYLTSRAIDYALIVDHGRLPTHAGIVLTHQRWPTCTLTLVAHTGWCRPTHLGVLINRVQLEIERTITHSTHADRMRSIAVFIIDA